VIDQPSMLGVHSSDSSHVAYFSSHVSPLFADHASPAACAAGVVLSSHLFFATHTWVREVSVPTARPLWNGPSSLPGGGNGETGPSIPQSASGPDASSHAATTTTAISQARIWPRTTSTRRAAIGFHDLVVLRSDRLVEWSGFLSRAGDFATRAWPF